MPSAQRNRPCTTPCRRSTSAFVSLVLAALAFSLPGWAQTPDRRPVHPSERKRPVGKNLIDKATKPLALDQDGRINVMVELTEKPSVLVYADGVNRRHLSAENAHAEAEAWSASVAATHQSIKEKLQSAEINAKVIFSVTHAYNGIAVEVRPEKIVKIRAIAGVKDVHALTPKHPTAASAVAFEGVSSFWNTIADSGLGVHGENIKIASIDTGIDYIHTNFAGPGTAAAYANNPTTTLPNPYFPNSRVKGGYDFAGDAYTGFNTPEPDPVPFDGNGHGTATASVLAGSGVNADGTTYTGPYDSTTPLSAMLIGPGTAPKADIYSLRVFGDEGDTNLVTEAVDWAVEHQMNVMSLSLGGAGGPADDPDTVALNNAALGGIVTVVSAGNDGDNYYVVGSPSVATAAISVGASLDSDYPVSFVSGNKPSQLAQLKSVFTAGQGAQVPSAGVTGDAVYAVPHLGLAPNSDGSVPPLTNAADIKGHICVIDRGTYPFAAKVEEAQNAGAIAVVIVNNSTAAVSPETENATYTPAIPNGIISLADGQTIETYLDPNGTDAGDGTDGPVNLTLAPAPGAATDNMASYSSRGPREDDGLLKPDIVSPAQAIDMALLGSGYGVTQEAGTSFSCPNTAGAMALLLQVHPLSSGWTIEQLKAAIMNTAEFDLTVDPTDSTKIGIGRAGAGRMDLTAASKATALAYSTDLPGAVSVSFGVVDTPIGDDDNSGVDDPAYIISRKKTIKVVNKSGTKATFTLGLDDTGTDVPGVTFNVPATVTVPAATTRNGVKTDGTATFDVTLTADPYQMMHTHDPSIALTQDGVPRPFISEATDYVTLTPSGAGPTLRVPVHAMPRPVSDMHATDAQLVLSGASGTANIDNGGNYIFTSGNFTETDIYSFLKILELQYISPQQTDLSATEASANLQYVGVASDYQYQASQGGDVSDTTLNFGIAAYGNFGSPDGLATQFNILIDSTAGDTFTPDYVVYNYLLGTPDDDFVNIFTTMVVNLNNGATTIEDPIDGVFGQVDIDLFNNSVLTMPFPAADVGLTNDQSRFNYQVYGYYDGLQIDETPILTYDPVNPGLTEVEEGAEPDFDFDQPGQYSVTYDNAAMLANRSLGALLLHFQNASLKPGATSQVSDRADILLSDVPEITGFGVPSAFVGETITILGANLSNTPGTSGNVTVIFFPDVSTTGTASADGTSVSVIVPPGAQTGTVLVGTETGTATSRQKLVITLPPVTSARPAGSTLHNR